MSFFAELKRRNVFKVAASYAIVAWIVLQVADTTFPALNIPAWVLSLLTVFFLLGFPLALFVAWAYEMTPEGIKPTLEVPVESSIREQTGLKMNYLMIGGLAMLLVVIAVDAYLLRDAVPAVSVATAQSADMVESSVQAIAPAIAEADVPALSIAVLPFRDLSPDGDQAWLADGVSEEISNLLTRVDDLLVINTNSAFQFRGQEQNFDSIRQRLNVNYLLTGSLQRIDDELRLRIQLGSTLDGSQLWSTTYMRNLEDVFAVQQEIAEAVSTALQITLATGTFGTTRGMTRNVEAYEEYLRGVQAIEGGESVENVRLAITHFETALLLDPDFTAPSAALYGLYSPSGLLAFIAVPAQFPERDTRAREALEHIRRVAPDDPNLMFFEAQELATSGNMLAAQAKFEQAMAASPGWTLRGVQLGNYALLRMSMGEAREAVSLLERQRAADPLNPSVVAWLAEAHSAAGNIERALQLIDEALTFPGQGNNVRLLGNRLLIHIYMRDPAVLANYDGRLPASGPEGNAQMLELVRDPAAGLEFVRSRAADSGQSAQSINMLAVWAAHFGDPQYALELTRRRLTIERGLSLLLIFRPVFSEMRKLDDFKSVVRDLGLVDYWQATGDWGDFCRPLPGTENDFTCE